MIQSSLGVWTVDQSSLCVCLVTQFSLSISSVTPAVTKETVRISEKECLDAEDKTAARENNTLPRESESIFGNSQEKDTTVCESRKEGVTVVGGARRTCLITSATRVRDGDIAVHGAPGRSPGAVWRMASSAVDHASRPAVTVAVGVLRGVWSDGGRSEYVERVTEGAAEAVYGLHNGAGLVHGLHVLFGVLHGTAQGHYAVHTHDVVIGQAGGGGGGRRVRQRKAEGALKFETWREGSRAMQL